MRDLLAIIPARGGSKGIPGKNLSPVAGVPLVVRSVQAALAAERVGRVVVSTDDARIAAAARAAGAEIVERPAALSGDTASSESALLHALDQLEAQGPLPPAFLFLQCTSPLTLPEDVDGAAALIESGADSVFSGTAFHGFVWRPDGDDLTGVNHDKRERQRRQDRPAEFLENGAVYAMRTDGFRRAKHRFFGRTSVWEMPAWRSVDVDAPEDLVRARQLAERLPSADRLPRPPSAVIFDFDGVFTDNRVWIDVDGNERVACNRSDGHGLNALRQAGVPLLVLSTEQVPVVLARTAKLKLPTLHGVSDKAAVLRRWAVDNEVDLSRAVFVGNDVNDVPAMELVGWPVAVADAHPTARAAARLVLSKPGGHGAVRELIDQLITLES